jgi:hypothetical protein
MASNTNWYDAFMLFSVLAFCTYFIWTTNRH